MQAKDLQVGDAVGFLDINGSYISATVLKVYRRAALISFHSEGIGGERRNPKTVHVAHLVKA